MLHAKQKWGGSYWNRPGWNQQCFRPGYEKGEAEVY